MRVTIGNRYAPFQSVTLDITSDDRWIGIPTKEPQRLPLSVSCESHLHPYFLAQARAQHKKTSYRYYGNTYSVRLDNTGKTYLLHLEQGRCGSPQPSWRRFQKQLHIWTTVRCIWKIGGDCNPLRIGRSLPWKHELWGYTVDFTHMGSTKASTYGTQSSTGSRGFIEWGPGTGRSATSGSRGDGGAQQGLLYGLSGAI